MTDSSEGMDRRQALKTITGIGVSAATAGCLGDLRDRVEGDKNSEETPSGGGSTPEETSTPHIETKTETDTETETETPEPENTFQELNDQIEKVETDSNLKQNLGPNFYDDSLELHKEMLEERDIEDVEDWGLYATVEVTDFNNWDDLDGIYNSGEEGKNQLENKLSRAGWDIFQTINRYAGDLIDRDQVNQDSITEVGMIFEDDEGETAGYIATEEDLDEIYSADSLEDSYKSHFRDEFGLYPLEEETKNSD